MDRFAGDFRFFVITVGHIFGALRGADQRACFRRGSGARSVHSDFSGARRWRLVTAVCVARTGSGQPRQLHRRLERVAVDGQQSGVHCRDGNCAAGHAIPAGDGCVFPWQILGGATVFQRRVRAADGAGDAVYDYRSAVPLAGGFDCAMATRADGALFGRFGRRPGSGVFG